MATNMKILKRITKVAIERTA